MIQGKHLYKSYGKTVVLQDFSFAVEPGERVFLSGPSGRGKTTLLRLLAGLEKPDKGEIFGLKSEEISFLFQEPRLFDHLTALENVTCIAPDPAAARDAALQLLSDLGLADAVDKVPSQLSGGMKQRVALARALAADRPVLLMDEPFTALDEGLKDRVRALVAQKIQGKTLLLVSHDPEDGQLLTDRKIEL